MNVCTPSTHKLPTGPIHNWWWWCDGRAANLYFHFDLLRMGISPYFSPTPILQVLQTQVNAKGMLPARTPYERRNIRSVQYCNRICIHKSFQLGILWQGVFCVRREVWVRFRFWPPPPPRCGTPLPSWEMSAPPPRGGGLCEEQRVWNQIKIWSLTPSPDDNNNLKKKEIRTF